MGVKLNIEAMLADVPVFVNMQAAQLAPMTHAGRQLRVEKHDFVFRRGDAASGLYVVVAGHIKLSIPSPTGSEKVLDFFGPGQAFGESGLLLDRPYLVDAQALEDAVLISIDRQQVQAALEQDPSFARYMLMNLARRMDALVQDIEAVNLQSAAQRLACYLLRLPRTDGRTRFPFSKTLVASKLGLSPETLSRLLHQLTSAGLISVQGRSVMIHKLDALSSQQFVS